MRSSAAAVSAPFDVAGGCKCYTRLGQHGGQENMHAAVGGGACAHAFNAQMFYVFYCPDFWVLGEGLNPLLMFGVGLSKLNSVKPYAV